MVLSADPVTNHWLPGSTAMDLTQPRWPLMTCHRKHNTVRNRIRPQFAVILLNILVKKAPETKTEAAWLRPTWTHPGQFPRSMPLGFGHGRRFPHQWGGSSATSFHEWLKWTRPSLALHCVRNDNSRAERDVWFECETQQNGVTYESTGLRMGPLSSSGVSVDLSHTGCRAARFLPKSQQAWVKLRILRISTTNYFWKCLPGLRR